MIEHGASGSSAGWSVKALFDDYFDLQSEPVETDETPEGNTEDTDE